MIALLSDLDGMSGVEVSNRSVIRQAVFGGGKQKEVIGERQIYALIESLDKGQMDTLYTRLTGDTAGLPWKATKESKNYDGDMSTTPKSIWDMGHKDRMKFQRFHTELAVQAGAIADMSEILLGKWARMGLSALIQWRADELQTALSNPANVAKYTEWLTKSGTLDRDPNFLVGLFAILVKLGVQVPLAILSKWMIWGYIESSKLTSSGAKGSMSLGTNIGESGSAGISLDGLGVRLDAKWNDPAARISGRTQAFMDALKVSTNTPVAARQKLTESALKDFVPTDAKDTKQTQIQDQAKMITDSYNKSMTHIDKLGYSEKTREVYDKNTVIYLSRLEELKWTNMSGLFLAAWVAGAFVWTSFSQVWRSATETGVKDASSQIEANALPKDLSPDEITRYMKELEITQVGSNFERVIDGKKEVIIVPPGKEIVWHFHRLVDTEIDTTRATYTFEDIQYETKMVQNGTKQESIVGTWRAGVPKADLVFTRSNEALPRYIDTTSTKAHADFIKGTLRGKNGTAFKKIEDMITAGNIDNAKTALGTLLSTKALAKDPTATSIATQLSKNTDTSDYMMQILELSSGSQASRKMALDIDTGKKVDLVKYYKENNLAGQFGEQYGLSSAQVLTIISQYGDLTKNRITDLSSGLSNQPFQAILAFNQINGNARFKQTVGMNHGDARIIGTPKLATPDTDTQFRATIANGMSAADISAWKTGLEASMPETLKWKITDVEVKDIIINNKLPQFLVDAGFNVDTKSQVYTFLSFVEHAECFNLGAAITPPGISRPVDLGKTPETRDVPNMVEEKTQKSRKNTWGTGSTVAIPGANILNWGVGIGGKLPKKTPEKKKEDTPPPGDTDKKPAQPAGSQDSTTGWDKTPVKPGDKPPEGPVVQDPVKPVGPRPPDKQPDPGTAVNADD
jgi:hypothetical protein